MRIKKQLSLNPRNPQEGFAAITVTMILMVVLSLIVLGFAASARREQQNALDSQLSTQAYYAAESGVNDAYAIITKDIENGVPIQSIQANTQNCINNNPYVDNGSNVLNGQVSYSCLLVNPTPNALSYQSLLAGSGEVVPLDAENSSGNPSQLGYLTISWQESNPPTPDFSKCPNAITNAGDFPPQTGTGAYSSSCTAPVLQLDIFNANDLSEATSPSSDTAVFMQPVSNGGAATNIQTIPTADAVIHVECSSTPVNSYPNYCTATLNLSSDDSDNFYLRIVPFYQNADVSISATAPDSSTPLDLVNAQAVIDSTGEANGQLKRLQENVCISDFCNNNAPVNALQSTNGVCKEFTTYPGNTTFIAGSGSPPTC